jgi:hypothetical protein
MKKLLVTLCLGIIFVGMPAVAKPAPKCKPQQSCKVHKMLQGHKVPVKKK